MIELQTNANAYFLKGSLAFGGIPPKMANCVDTNAIEQIKAADKLPTKELST
jgi:hypothetical protein